MIKKTAFASLATILVLIIGFVTGLYWQQLDQSTSLINPLVSPEKTEPEKPLLAYTIENLRNYNFNASSITISEVIEEYPDYTAYKFSYAPLGQTMSGQLNIPNQLQENPKVIIMVRGWVPENIYQTGVGTRNAAGAFAENGYITLAPDFFGYGDSDPEPEDGWLARFQKPVVIIELLKSVEQMGVPTSLEANQLITTNDIGFWAHSNGGQITLTALEILSEPHPTTLWAPVTAPFPYSILYFSDEHPDEGKDFRQYVANFEKNYDVFDFTLTQHLDLLTGPFQFHHGAADEAAPIIWSDEFVDKIEAENQRREDLQEQLVELETRLETDSVATNSASISAITKEINQIRANNILETIEYQYFTYPGADHNLVPSWDTAMERDLSFFANHL